jgi:hypothetical protein
MNRYKIQIIPNKMIKAAKVYRMKMKMEMKMKV